MGVAGCGKTTVGQKLAEELGWRFDDADQFHPEANIAKMTAGVPLDDTDRQPWLRAIRTHIETMLRRDTSIVVTCSALKQRYRDEILGSPSAKLVYLRGTPELLQKRIEARKEHFMKPTMLASQLAALEEPKDAITLDIAAGPAELVAKIRRAIER
ncbi:gluconate kinase [Opitutaceae bacterium EW11]|nr:gluconate kinase [Opitutaceae bacterium EW11]